MCLLVCINICYHKNRLAVKEITAVHLRPNYFGEDFKI